MALPPQISTVKAPSADVSRAQPSRRQTRFNLPFLLVVTLLVGYGLMVVWSAVSSDSDYSFTRQLAGVAVGAVLMLLIWQLDYRRLADLWLLLLVVNVVLILSPHIPGLGVEAKGAQSWIKIGMQVQPGEFAKFTVVLYAASLVARYGGKLDNAREYAKTVLLLLVPFLCIMTQPDLGTGLVYLFISATALVVGGARPKFLLVTLFLGIVAIALVFVADEFVFKYEKSPGVYEYKLLKNYQRSRLFVFLNPDLDPTGEGYNLKQAQIAIGSGGLFGKGLLGATQSTHGFLPEAPTDFIFCVLAEELGFFGVVILLSLYVCLILLCFSIARSSNDLFGTLIVMCVVGMWLFQILENIGMDCGLMPITGIPLPFVSYGSSFMVVNFMMLGLIGSVWFRNNAAGKKGGYATSR